MKHTSIALGIVLIASTCAYAQDWPDPVALDVVPYETAGLTHGPCLGRPEPTRMTVWVRTKQPTAFQVVYDTRPRLDDNSPAVNGETTAADNTGYVTLSGLQPNSRYWYGIRIDGRLADLRVDFHDRWPTFRTLPDTTACADAENNPEGLFNFAFSVGHCASQDPFRSGGHYASPPAFDTLCSQFGRASCRERV